MYSLRSTDGYNISSVTTMRARSRTQSVARSAESVGHLRKEWQRQDSAPPWRESLRSGFQFLSTSCSSAYSVTPLPCSSEFKVQTNVLATLGLPFRIKRSVGILGEYAPEHEVLEKSLHSKVFHSAELRDGTKPRVLALKHPGRVSHTSQMRWLFVGAA